MCEMNFGPFSRRELNNGNEEKKVSLRIYMILSEPVFSKFRFPTSGADFLGEGRNSLHGGC
jgi:hypothetical protein